MSGYNIDMIEQKKIEELLSQVRKPGRYLGNEWNVVKKDLAAIPLKFALCFPDLYEVGMSNLGYKLIYHLVNERDDTACERVFMPEEDLESILRKEGLPLFSLESKEALNKFDVVGFSLSYELSYTNFLRMLDLGGIPLLSTERGASHPLVIAGGPSVFNPEPIADFVDVFVIGEAEESIAELLEDIKKYKAIPASDKEKRELLKRLSRIEGIYVPSLYKDEYGDDGVFKSLKPIAEDVPEIVKKRKIDDLSKSYYPTKQIVPYIGIVHDRASVEVMRGCGRVCRFCQARVLYHPKRERPMKEVIRLTDETLDRTGYDEVSLLSLSTGDHSEISQIIGALIEKYKKKGVSVSLPSLRIAKVLKELPAVLSKIKKSGLTFAPEAGSERMKSIINKHIDIAELKAAVEAAGRAGWSRVKLYFMIGLPGESYDDIQGIIDTISGIMDIDRRMSINVSINQFIPKSHTPFQWQSMDSEDEILKKAAYLKKGIRAKRVKFKFNDTRLSLLEGVFSQGDRRLGRVIKRAFEKGCKFDGWADRLNFNTWTESFKDEDISLSFYTHRKKDFSEHLPWDHIDCGITKDLLVQEAKKALELGA